MKKLSKDEMKKVVGGNANDLGDENENPKPCQEHGDICATDKQLNCCNGLVCADYKCQYRTV